MTLRITALLKYIASALLTIVCLYVAFRDMDFGGLYVTILRANYWGMLGMFVSLLVSHAFRALRWRYLLDPVKPNISFRNLFSGVMIGYFINNLLPRAGELVRPYSIAKIELIPKSAALGTIVVERIMDTGSFLVLVLLIPLVYNGPLTQAFPWLQRTGIIVSLLTSGFLLAAVVLVIRRDWTNELLRRVSRFFPASAAATLNNVIHSFLDGFLFVKRPANFLAILVLSILVWFLYIVMTYLAFFSFGLEQELGFGAALVLLAISSIGVAIPTPGAIGGYHLFAQQTLIRLFHVSNEVALSYATLTHAIGFIGITVVGLYFFMRDHINLKDAMDKPVGHVG